jgi:hypothetical protein
MGRKCRKRRRRSVPVWKTYSSWRQFLAADKDGIKNGVGLMLRHRNDLWDEWRAYMHAKNHRRVLQMMADGVAQSQIDEFRVACTERCYAHYRACPACKSHECDCCACSCTCVDDDNLEFYRTV